MLKTRKQALEAGELKYNTGKPCKHGHMSDRYSRKGECITCNLERQKTQSVREAKNRYVEGNRAEHNERVRKRYHENINQERERSREYRRKNLDKENARIAKYRRDHPEKRKQYEAMRRKRVIQATPPWLSKEDRQAIVDLYVQCPKGHEVDHIYPLRGENSCGLHVPWNLQYLTKEENQKKGNRLPVN